MEYAERKARLKSWERAKEDGRRDMKAGVITGGLTVLMTTVAKETIQVTNELAALSVNAGILGVLATGVSAGVYLGTVGYERLTQARDAQETLINNDEGLYRQLFIQSEPAAQPSDWE